MQKIVESYQEVVNIILKINKLHSDFSYQNYKLLSLNLKKSTVDSVIGEKGIESGFNLLVREYRTALNRNMTIITELQNKFPSIRYRVKQAESVSEKLLYYLIKDDNSGRFPINKCLNDLLGFRFGVINLEKTYEQLESDKRVSELVKMYLRKDNAYEGLHIYFKNENNKFFPWELQIWDSESFETNEISHKQHKEKRKYILLPKSYHNINLKKGE